MAMQRHWISGALYNGKQEEGEKRHNCSTDKHRLLFKWNPHFINLNNVLCWTWVWTDWMTWGWGWWVGVKIHIILKTHTSTKIMLMSLNDLLAYCLDKGRSEVICVPGEACSSLILCLLMLLSLRMDISVDFWLTTSWIITQSFNKKRNRIFLRRSLFIENNNRVHIKICVDKLSKCDLSLR